MLFKVNATNSPNQTINFVANKQNFTLNLYWRGYVDLPGDEQDFLNTYAVPQYFADIFLNNVLIIAGTPVIDRIPINVYPSLINGYLVSIDSLGNDNPNLETMGIQIIYIILMI